MTTEPSRMTAAELNAWALNFKSRTLTNFAAYGLDEDQSQAFMDAQLTYAAKYQLAFDKNTRTAPVIQGRDAAREALVTIARQLIKVAQAWPAMTDAKRSELMINIPKVRTKITRPGVRPGVDLVGTVGRNVSIHIHDAASSTKRGKAAKCVAAWVYSYVGETYPSDPSLWTFCGSTTKNSFDVEFPSTIAGGTSVWVCAAWINAKQEAGPTSFPIQTTLQGGGEQSAEAKLKIAA